jgi:phosphatidylserine/phosphatidylglycerophosphate/cardiolipin synthase-like enzyme
VIGTGRKSPQIIVCILTVIFTFSLLSSCISQGDNSLSTETKFEVGFSPDGTSLDIILKGIQQAKKSILVAAYSFTSKPISTALLEAHKRGVRVQVIADKGSNTRKYSAVTFLANQGVPVRVNENYQIFHHKFMVFDDLHVETGSFNYSAAAVNRNAENVLMIWNNKSIADTYTKQWDLLWDESMDVKSNY